MSAARKKKGSVGEKKQPIWKESENCQYQMNDFLKKLLSGVGGDKLSLPLVEKLFGRGVA